MRFQPFKYRVILALAAAFFGVKKPRGRWDLKPQPGWGSKPTAAPWIPARYWKLTCPPWTQGPYRKRISSSKHFQASYFEMAMFVFEGWHITWEVFFNETFRLPNPNGNVHPGHTEIVELYKDTHTHMYISRPPPKKLLLFRFSSKPNESTWRWNVRHHFIDKFMFEMVKKVKFNQRKSHSPHSHCEMGWWMIPWSRWEMDGNACFPKHLS